ncbi:cysteate synthase [Methanoregula sp.]|jgi:cysteate synthase|uniref:cysteate synthase n=1 Tax=Methanoregula sp. TaxID=2052170 RepID=UPI003C15176A
MIPKYRLSCVGGGEVVEDISLLSCPNGHDSLLRTGYCSRKLHLAPHEGMYRYLAWLPVTTPLLPSGGAVTFTSDELSRELGLTRLSVSFSGYFPERGATLSTGSFKELEASPTMQRLQELGGKIPVIASAGNTGRAFAELSARCKRPVVIVIPEKAIPRLWTTEPAHDIFLVAVKGDYLDAIVLSNTLAGVPGCVPEGGAKNVARRDGMGTVMLDAAVTTGRIPDHYFQAVGSGTGAIAAWEAAMRLIRDGSYGDRLPQLHLAQNEPFTPMVSAWAARRREIIPAEDMPDAVESIGKVMSDVLTNRNPPYGIRGGLFDALLETQGCMYSVPNAAGAKAEKLIRETVGIDPDPAAAIATAALVEAVEKDIIGAGDHILLNLTGGGYERIREDFTLHAVIPAAVIRPDEPRDALVTRLREWIRHHGRKPDH